MSARHQNRGEEARIDLSGLPSLVGRTQVDGPPRSFFMLRGQPIVYRALSHSGQKDEGGEVLAAKNAHDALFWMRHHLNEYLNQNRGDVVWRERPVLRENRSGSFCCYARLAVVPEGSAGMIEVEE